MLHSEDDVVERLERAVSLLREAQDLLIAQRRSREHLRDAVHSVTLALSARRMFLDGRAS